MVLQKGHSSGFRLQARQSLGMVGKEKLSKGQSIALRKKMLELAKLAELREIEKLRKNNSLVSGVSEKGAMQKKQLWEREINPQKEKKSKKIARAKIRSEFDLRVREVYAWPEEKIRAELARIHNEMVRDRKILTPKEREIVHISAFFFEPSVHPKAKLKAANLIVKHMLK